MQLGTPDDAGEGKKPKRFLPKGMEPSMSPSTRPSTCWPCPVMSASTKAKWSLPGSVASVLSKKGSTYANIPKDESVLEIGLNRAVALIVEKQSKMKGGELPQAPSWSKHPKDEKPITLHDGRYGPYVKHGRTNATLPKGSDPKAVTLEEAIALIDAKKEKDACEKIR